MIDNIFDKLIKRKLEKFRFRYNPESWKRLEEKLSQSEDEDIVFDTMISEKLRSFSVPLSANSFARFEEKYLTGNSPVRKFYYYVAAVAAVLILVLLVFMNIDSGKKNLNDLSSLDKNLPNTNTNTEIEDIAKFDMKANHNESTIANVEATKSFNSNDHISSSQYNNADSKNTNNQIESTLTGYRSKPDFGLKYNPFVNGSERINPLYMGYNYINDEYKNFNEFSGTLNIHIQLIPVQTDNQDVNAYVSNEIADNKTAKIINDAGETKDPELIFPAIDSLPLIQKGRSTLALNGYFSPDMDIINTPNDLTFNVPGYSHIEKSITAGLSLSYKKGRNEVEAGFEYFNMSYSPHKNPVKLDRSIVYLDKIEFKNIGIPVNYKYHLVDNRNWDLYTVSGISANMTTGSKYEFVEKINQNENEFVLKKLAQELQKDIHFKNTLYAQKDYSPGTMEGGEFNNNFYLAINAGVGVKRKFGKGYSLYFEPNYKYLFNRFNPNNDMIQKLNFKFGLSVNLNSI